MILQISEHINQNHNNYKIMEEVYGQFKYIGYFTFDDQYYPGVYQRAREGKQHVFITLSSFCNLPYSYEQPISIIFFEQAYWNPPKPISKSGQNIPKITINTKGPYESIGIKNEFLRFKLEIDQNQMKFFQDPPQLIPYFDIRKFSSSKMLAIGFQEGSITATQWLQDHYQVSSGYGAYFIEQKQTKKLYFYGFYDLTQKDQLRFDNFFHKECLDEEPIINNVGQSSRLDSLRRKVQKEDIIYPRNSIYKLKFHDNGSGTASVLVNNQGYCKYLITCAHNFYGIAINQQKQPYIYERDKQKDKIQIFQYLGDHIQLINSKVKDIHMPYEYRVCVEKRLDDYNTPSTFRLKGVKMAIKLYEETLHDIAIIELCEPFCAKQGFQIRPPRKFEDIKQPFEQSGFPKQDSQVYTQKDCMYYDSSSFYQQKDEKAFVNLQKYGSYTLIVHNLFTIQGNSGSPIYGQIEQDRCYLFGIHTKGIPSPRTQEQIEKKLDQPFGQQNCATYLYSKNILEWLNSKTEFQEFMAKQ